MTLRRIALALLALSACERPARIDLEPASVQLYARGQTVKLHATPRAKSGRPLAEEICAWSSTDDRVATVSSPRNNEAVITAAGNGSVFVRCRVAGRTAEAPVTVRIPARLSVAPPRVELRLSGRPEPAALDVQVFDADGNPISGRVVATRCENESVCRGDNRGQIWPVGPGTSRAVVEVGEASAEVTAHVVDGRAADERPRRVKGNPMLHIDEGIGTSK